MPLKPNSSIGLIVLNACLAALAQQSGPATQSQSESPQRAPVIWITARNEDGSPAELSASDVELKIDGNKTQVGAFRRLRPPLRYCLLFDVSGSLTNSLRQQQNEAIALLSMILQAGRDYGMLVAFNTTAYVDAEGSDPQKLMKAITTERVKGYTALYDAMAACSNALAKAAHESDSRVMFIFSDGEDNASYLKVDGVLLSIAKAGVRVYSIGHPRSTRALHALKQFAENTGGKNYFSANQEDIEKKLADISGDFDSMYSVQVESANPLLRDHVYKVAFKCSKKSISLGTPRHLVLLP